MTEYGVLDHEDSNALHLPYLDACLYEVNLYITTHHIQKAHYNLMHCIVHHPMHAPE